MATDDLGGIFSEPHHSWIQKVLYLKQFGYKYEVFSKTVTQVIMKETDARMFVIV